MLSIYDKAFAVCFLIATISIIISGFLVNATVGFLVLAIVAFIYALIIVNAKKYQKGLF